MKIEMKIETICACVVTAGSLLAGGIQPVEAQEPSVLRAPAPWATKAPPSLQIQAQTAEDDQDDGSILGLAKWSTLALSAGASAYGFYVNAQADDRFEEIQGICQQDPARCENRTSDGAFADGELEARYQEVLDKDRNARAALILAQVGLATSIVLFVLDLDGGESPPDIPFDPPRVSVTPDQTRLSWTVPLPFH